MMNGKMICNFRTAWVRKSQLLSVLSIVLGLMLAAQSGIAQISAGGTPPSQIYSIKSDVPTVSLPVTNVADLKAEDELESKDVPKRFGAPIETALNMSNSGEWTELPDGGRMWRLRRLRERTQSTLCTINFICRKVGNFFFTTTAIDF
jgi:hypothetical protein